MSCKTKQYMLMMRIYQKYKYIATDILFRLWYTNFSKKKQCYKWKSFSRIKQTSQEMRKLPVTSLNVSFARLVPSCPVHHVHHNHHDHHDYPDHLDHGKHDDHGKLEVISYNLYVWGSWRLYTRKLEVICRWLKLMIISQLLTKCKLRAALAAENKLFFISLTWVGNKR